MAKNYVNINVYEAAQERLKFIFEHFENVLVAFSGGKDSGVCLNLVYDYAKEHDMIDKVSMYHLDYEAQYQMTTDYVTETFEQFSDINRFWLCLPIGAQCACRMDSDRWIPWEKSKQDLWVRQMPEYDFVVNEDNCMFDMNVGQMDYEVQDNFCKWFSEEHGSTAVVIGIRATESLNRYRTVSSQRRVNYYQNNKWTTVINDKTVNVYPIYDWETQDVWVYNSRFMKPYNHLYDLYYQAGLSIDQMRVASPFCDSGIANLNLYKIIDPNNWGTMVGRVNGVNMASLYGNTTAMGWRNITKPPQYTWKEYCLFLLSTLPESTRNHYLEKLKVSLKFWKEKGGALEDRTIQELKDEGAKFTNRGAISKTTTKDVVTFEDYLDDTTATKFQEVPTWKRMCVCIIKNDYTCKYMGFARTKREQEKRNAALQKYANL